ncbi:hypothetical protein Tco_0652960 [Tanacetum coccineum]|uniref:Phospholipase-like protein n=1 Tax=Tanacetum coccineum TaxID=301880 RepID=A0ABQ4WZ37_9ASTR
MYSCIIMHNMILEDQQKAFSDWNKMYANPSRNMHRTWIERYDVQRRKAKELRDKEVHLSLQRNLMEHIWQQREGHTLHFGRREFSLITGFIFGTDEETFCKLSNEDAVRLYLLLVLEVIFMGWLLTFKVDDTLFRLVDNLEAWNSFPWGEHLWTHLYDEIKNLKKGTILETFERCERKWIKDPKIIPRALGWSRKSLFTRSDYSYLFAKESRSTSDLRPTIAEYQSSWWIDNNVYFKEHVPRDPPIREQHSLFETYLSKLEKARKRRKTGFMVTSIGGTSDNSVRKKWLNDIVITKLNFLVFKLETIIQVLAHERNDRQAKLQFTDELSNEDIAQDYLREEKLRLCLEDEKMLCCEHEKLIVEGNRFRLDEANRLRLEEENMLQLAEQKKNKQKEFMNSSHGKNILAKLAPAKMNQLGFGLEKKISKDISRVYHSKDTILLSDDIERFLGQTGQVKCKFPWNNDYTVDRNFWLKLVCLDPARKGWLTEERYTTPWSEVDQLQTLVGSNIAAESARMFREFQDDELEKARGMMKLISETQLKVLKKISFIALLRRQ